VKVVFIEFIEDSPKTFWLSFGNALSMSISFWLTFHILGFEPFSGAFKIVMFFSKSVSAHSSFLASPASHRGFFEHLKKRSHLLAGARY
jgi:hypothetical protein